MGHSKTNKAESRERIVSAAARQIRAGGLESVSIAELMKTAGLTHGGFYGHFPSRSALLVAALDRALTDGAKASSDSRHDAPNQFARLVRSYVSSAHRDHADSGCAVTALAAEAARAGNDVRAVMRNHVQTFIGDTAAMIGDDEAARETAMAAWCTMVGAISLARLFEDEPLADDILVAARRSLLSVEPTSS